MIVIGSRAAIWQGVLPDWREGQSISGDIDLLATQDQRDAFRLHDAWYDIHVVPPEMYDLAWRLAGAEGHYFGRTMRLATPEILWASLYLTAGCNPLAHAKSFRDFFHYAALPLALTDDHHRLALMFRDTSLAAIRHRYVETPPQP